MAKHSKRSSITGRYAPIAVTGSKPHRSHTRNGVSDMDREMEAATHESAKWNEGRWDEEAEINASITDGLNTNEDWKGRGNTVAGVWQGSQHRRKGKGYDSANVVAVDPRSNYKPDARMGGRPNLVNHYAGDDETARFISSGE